MSKYGGPGGDTLRMKKEDLIAHLESLLPAAEADDKKRMAAHKQQEQEYLKLFREVCREAVKWDYETAKANYFKTQPKRASPSCPTLTAPRIQEALRRIRIDGRQVYTLSAGGRSSRIFDLVTWTPEPIDMSGGCK